MGDSHLSMVGKTLEINAVNSVSIRGGRIQSIRKYLEGKGWLKGVNYFFILGGGNDLDGGSPAKVATELEDLVFDLRQKNQDVVVVTGTIIPRGGAVDNQATFVDKVFRVDSLMSQWGVHHHHFLSDIFFADAGPGGPGGIREELFIYDRTHLNKQGRELLIEAFEFLIMSVETNNFTGRHSWGTEETARSIMWKF